MQSMSEGLGAESLAPPGPSFVPVEGVHLVRQLGPGGVAVTILGVQALDLVPAAHTHTHTRPVHREDNRRVTRQADSTNPRARQAAGTVRMTGKATIADKHYS